MRKLFHQFAAMKKLYIIFLILFIGIHLQAQEVKTSGSNNFNSSKSIFNPEVKRNFSRKGDWFFYYGYNFSWYNKSDINFKGPGYDFTLKDVKAHDRPSKLSWDYLNPGQITTPQVNIHFGYYIKDNYSISLGWDHMKYVMDIPQTVKIQGYINPTISNPAIPTGKFAGVYNGESITVPEEMLSYEHTDGFNYVSAEIQRYDDLWSPRNQTTSLTLETGLGIGTVIPRSDVHLFGVGQNNYWNFAGYGFSAKAGLKFYITKGFFIQNSTKVGWTNLTHVHTTGRNELDRASQKISFLENYTVLGVQF